MAAMAWVSPEVSTIFFSRAWAFLLTSEGLREEDAADVPWERAEIVWHNMAYMAYLYIDGIYGIYGPMA